MPGPLNVDAKLRLFDAIGKEHLTSDLFQKTTNFMGRSLSQVFSKGSHNKAVKELVDSIRQTPGFGDKYATLAQQKLDQALTKGQPLTGRLAAKVLRDIKMAQEGDKTRETNIGINIDTAFESHALDFQDTMDHVILNYFHDKGGEMVSDSDRTDMLKEAKEKLKAAFPEKSPTLQQMQDRLEQIVEQKCQLKLRHNENVLAHKVTGKLEDDIRSSFEELGFDISFSLNMLDQMKKAIESKIHQQGPKLDHVMKEEEAEAIKQGVLDSIKEAFQAVKDSDIDEGDKTKIISILSQKAQTEGVLPTKELALSLCDGIEDDLCTELLDSIKEFDEDTNLTEMVNEFFEDVDHSAIDPESETNEKREGLTDKSMSTLRENFMKLTAGLESPLTEDTKGKIRQIIDKANELIDASDPEHPDEDITRLTQFKEMLAKAFGL